MRSIIEIHKKIVQPGFHNVTADVESAVGKLLEKKSSRSGILHLFCMHTSCALLINEAWDSTAKRDMEHFLNYLAPENLPFIQHTLEGPDDSPAHMKSALLHQNLSIIVEAGKLLLGQWQGIFLAEFRKSPHRRTILLKLQAD